jgi:hypothetical protein
MTDPSSAYRQCQHLGLKDIYKEREREREREDSLENSASHILATPHPREVPLLATIVLAATPAPYIDLTFIA